MTQAVPYPGDSLERLHAVELDVLRAIRKVCDEHDITYWLDGGTCLGAVRHGGFIPWDDDVDVAMPQEDYERFLRVAPGSLPEGFTLHTCQNTPGMSELWAKVERDGTRFIDELAHDSGHEQGIFVDVFCYRRLDEDDKEMQRQIRESSLCQRMSYLNATGRPKIPKSTPLRPVVRAGVAAVHGTVARAWTAQRMAERLDRAWESPCPGNRMTNTCYAYKSWQWRDTLLPTSTIEFEGEEFPCPAKPECYLEELYGDWRQLPPEDERYTHLPLVLDFGDGVNVMEAPEPAVADEPEERPEDVPRASSPSYPPGALARIQATELEMLAALDKICELEDITYWLDGGTLLGQQRHGGFIPWDDDTDIGMPVDDFLRFCEAAPKLLPEGMSLRTCYNAEGFYYFWVRICRDDTRFLIATAQSSGREDGIFMDIFPMVALDRKHPMQQLGALVNLQRLSLLHHIPYPDFPDTMPHKRLLELGCSAVHHTVARPFDTPALFEQFLGIIRRGVPGNLWHNGCIGYADPHPEEAVFPIRRGLFEGLEVNIPNDPDTYLTDIYGDWRKLPPADKRKTHSPKVLDFGDGVNVMEGWQA